MEVITLKITWIIITFTGTIGYITGSKDWRIKYGWLALGIIGFIGYSIVMASPETVVVE